MATIFGSAAYANIIGLDNRMTIIEGQATLSLNSLEITRIRESTGYVYCPGTTHGNPLMTSGALIHGDDVVVTNGHSFVDAYGRLREPLSECYFQTQGLAPERIKFEFSFASSEIVQDWTAHSGVSDYAVVRLKAKPKYGQAFPVASESALFVGQELILVSAKPKRVSAPFNGREPIVQACQVRKVLLPNSIQKTLFYGDCDTSPGSSGSVGLVRVNGELSALGVSCGGGGSELDGLPYDESRKSYSFHIAIRDSVLAAIVRIGGRPLVQ